MIQKKNKLARQKVAVKRLEASLVLYQDMLKGLEDKSKEHKQIALKLKRTNQALENTLKKMSRFS
jgi:hypothetical protein